MGIRFLHTLIFVCPNCAQTIEVSQVRAEMNLETLDRLLIDLTCERCHKTHKRFGITAMKHLAMPCSEKPDVEQPSHTA